MIKAAKVKGGLNSCGRNANEEACIGVACIQRSVYGCLCWLHGTLGLARRADLPISVVLSSPGGIDARACTCCATRLWRAHLRHFDRHWLVEFVDGNACIP